MNRKEPYTFHKNKKPFNYQTEFHLIFITVINIMLVFITHLPTEISNMSCSLYPLSQKVEWMLHTIDRQNDWFLYNLWTVLVTPGRDSLGQNKSLIFKNKTRPFQMSVVLKMQNMQHLIIQTQIFKVLVFLILPCYCVLKEKA